ncbi:MAG: sulfate reduction electron transfer complex DsrMKJOP subunit DsrO [Thermodesulfobacteriota bacterium]
MGIDRREFIRIAGLSTLLGLGGKGAFELLRPGQVEASMAAKPGAEGVIRWAMVVNMRKMDDDTAQKCAAACHRVHNVPSFAQPNDPKDALPPEIVNRYEVKWIWPEHFHNAFPGEEHPHLPDELKKLPFLLLCNHCDNPPCVRVCPTKATFRREDGIVNMDMHRCIGCRFCMAGCPFGARSFNWKDPRPYIAKTYPGYPTREIGMVEKCTFCAERLAQNLSPACVEASGGALVFGDLNDERSQVRAILKKYFSIRRKVHLGTNPQVYYIV